MQNSVSRTIWRWCTGSAIALCVLACGNDDTPRYNVAGDWREEITFTRKDGTTTQVSDYVRFTGTPSDGEWADSDTCGKFAAQSGKYAVEGTAISFSTMTLSDDGELRYHGEMGSAASMEGTVTTPDLETGAWRFTRIDSCGK